jgi:Putative zinc-finger
MNCRRAGDLLSPYLDGELTPSHATALEAHLAGCDSCRAELADLQRALTVLQTPLPLVQPVGMLAEFKSRLETAPRRPFPFFRPPALWLAPAGAVAAALLVAVVFYQTHGPAARPGGSVATSDRRMASVPPAGSPQDLLAEKATAPRDAESEQHGVARSQPDQKTEASGARPEQSLALKAPGQAPVSGGSNAVSTLPPPPMSGGIARSPGVGNLVDRPQPAGGRASTSRPRGAAQARDQLFGSPGRFAPRDDGAPTPSPTLSPPAVRRPSIAREGQARPTRLAARQPYLLPPGVPRPDAALIPPATRKARPSAAPAAPSPGASGPVVAAAPPPPAFSAARQDLGTPATGRAWVAVRFPTPAEAPGVAGQAPNDAGQELRAAAAPQAAGEADTTPSGRRLAKTARSRPAAPVVTTALMEAMRRPVRVAVADVPLTDLLRQISASAGVAITLDPQVPDTMRCHAELPDVPLYEALEKVADATRLVIALQGNGVALRPRAGALPNAHSPYWSREWGTAPETGFASKESPPRERPR